jgi:hypothetical protein
LGIAPLPRIQNLRNGISPDSKITRAHQNGLDEIRPFN